MDRRWQDDQNHNGTAWRGPPLLDKVTESTMLTQHLLSELATITDVTVLQMGHCADHQRTQAQTTDGLFVNWSDTM